MFNAAGFFGFYFTKSLTLTAGIYSARYRCKMSQNYIDFKESVIAVQEAW